MNSSVISSIIRDHQRTLSNHSGVSQESKESLERIAVDLEEKVVTALLVPVPIDDTLSFATNPESKLDDIFCQTLQIYQFLSDNEASTAGDAGSFLSCWKSLVAHLWDLWKTLLNELSAASDLEEEQQHQSLIGFYFECSVVLHTCYLTLAACLEQASAHLFTKESEESRQQKESAVFYEKKFIAENWILLQLWTAFNDSTVTIVEQEILRSLSRHEINLLLRNNSVSSSSTNQIQRLTPTGTSSSSLSLSSLYFYDLLINDAFTTQLLSQRYDYPASSGCPFLPLFLFGDGSSELLRKKRGLEEEHLKRWIDSAYFYHSRNYQVDQNKTSRLTANQFYEEIVTLSHIEISKFWNSLANHVKNDIIIAKTLLLSIKSGSLSQQNLELQSSSMIGIIAVATRLLDRYDQSSHLLGIHLLVQSFELMSGSQLLQFIEWILPKISLTFNIIETGFPKYYLTRLLQRMLSVTSQSNLLIQYSYQYLQNTLKAISLLYTPLEIWYLLFPLQYATQCFPQMLIQVNLSEFVHTLLHCLNIWHLPLQKLTVLQLRHLFDVASKSSAISGFELDSFISSILTELFRVYFFYSKNSLPDLSLRDDASLLRQEVLAAVSNLKKTIETSYADRYSLWGTQLTTEKMLPVVNDGILSEDAENTSEHGADANVRTAEKDMESYEEIQSFLKLFLAA